MIFSKKRRWFFLSLLFPLLCAATEQQTFSTALFQNRFFTLSTDSSLVCTTDQTGFLSTEKLVETIDFYEKNNPAELRKLSVAVLTDHSNVEHLKELADYNENCQQSDSIELCVLEQYWDDKQAALTALALFYDTKTIIKHGEDYSARRFTLDHVHIFEKAIRKISPFMRKKISKAKPIRELDKVIEDLDDGIQELIQDAFPADFATSIWSDDTHPLTFVPGFGYNSRVVAQVYNGQNLIIFNVKELDKAKDDRLYRDINLKYLVDFRMQIIVHEIAHTIDNFQFWNGNDDLYFFYKYRKMSNDRQIIQLIKETQLALWPSKWFEAFEYLWDVNEGRYDGRVQEKLAELVAQYILIPELLKQSSPKGYAWLRDDIFKGIEYQGYEDCSDPVVKPLNLWEDALAKVLGA